MFSDGFRTVVLSMGLCLCVSLAWAQDPAAPAKLEMTKDNIGYTLGVQFGKAIEYSKDRIDAEAMKRGLADVLSGAELEMTIEEMGGLLMEFQVMMEEDRTAALEAEGAAFLKANADKDGVMVLPSGLQYKVLKAGTGPKPKATDTVETHYRGTFIDGTEFDSSYSRGTPTQFPVTQVIAGWTEALKLMKVGAKWELYIPYNLAYGAQGRQGIPAYSVLKFELELLQIVDTP